MDIQRQAFEETFKQTEIYVREVKIRKKDILEYSPQFGYFSIVANDAWKMWQHAQKVAVHEWISLEDEEPNISETVLICWSDDFDIEPEKDFMDVDIDSGVRYWSNFENDKPTHWMPIPQPPKAQEPTND